MARLWGLTPNEWHKWRTQFTIGQQTCYVVELIGAEYGALCSPQFILLGAPDKLRKVAQQFDSPITSTFTPEDAIYFGRVLTAFQEHRMANYLSDTGLRAYDGSGLWEACFFPHDNYRSVTPIWIPGHMQIPIDKINTVVPNILVVSISDNTDRCYPMMWTPEGPAIWLTDPLIKTNAWFPENAVPTLEWLCDPIPAMPECVAQQPHAWGPPQKTTILTNGGDLDVTRQYYYFHYQDCQRCHAISVLRIVDVDIDYKELLQYQQIILLPGVQTDSAMHTLLYNEKTVQDTIRAWFSTPS